MYDSNLSKRESDYTPFMRIAKKKAETHRETEIKLAIGDLPALIGRLKELGAKPKGRVLERNSVFDTDGGALRQRGMLLRLRVETPARSGFASAGAKRMVLTAKSPAPVDGNEKAGKYKEKLEREIVLLDPLRRARGAKPTLRDRGWPFALGVIGFQSKFRYEKYRTTYALRGAVLDLDETPIGVFLEIEGKPAAIDRVARELGFGVEDYIRANYFQLYAAARRRKGKEVRHMLFPR
jgi:adenylate cyclase class 2